MLEITSAGISWKLHTQKMNQLLYLPANSNHPQHVFTGLLRGLAKRIRARCLHNRDAELALDFYAKKLNQRGYAWNMLKNYLLRSPKETIATGSSKSSGRRLVLTCLHSKGLRPRRIQQILSRHRFLLRKDLGACAPSVAWKIGKSLFRQNYSFSWRFV